MSGPVLGASKDLFLFLIAFVSSATSGYWVANVALVVLSNIAADMTMG